MAVKEILKETESNMKKAVDSLVREFSEVRTGRPSTELVENLHANYYGTPTPIKQIAAINVPDSQTLAIQPWDKGAMEPIEKTISESHLGISPMNDGTIIRLKFPPLSQERRVEMTKVVKDMAEKGRVSLRTVRRDANDHIKKMQNEKVISEDDSFKAQDDVQKLTDRYIKEVDVLLDKKSKDLMEI